MERLLGFAINDTSFLKRAVMDQRAIFQIDRALSDGGWGLGVHRHGEMLVQKRRVSAGTSSADEVIRAGARHAVLHVAPRRPGLFQLEQVQPYRYRNWLFASAGAHDLPQDFVSKTAEALRGFTAEGRWMACPVEGILLVYMQALQRVGELDRGRPHTRMLRQAMVEGTEALFALLGGQAGVSLALLLHVRDYTYALSLGRSMSVRSFYDTGSVHGELGRSGRHVRALAVTNDAPSDWGDTLPSWSIAEIGPSAEIEVFALR